MPRPVSTAFQDALGAQLIEPIELLRFVFKTNRGRNSIKEFAVWPTDVTFGGATFTSNPWIEVKDYAIGLTEFPTVSIIFLDAESQFRNAFATAPQIEGYPDLRGSSVTVFKVLKDQLSNEDDAIKDSFKISQWSANDALIELVCDTLLQSPQRGFPPFTYSRRVCQWVFKDPMTCQWIASQGGNAEFCDKTLAGEDGCKAHNNTEHFGAFPTIADEEIDTL